MRWTRRRARLRRAQLSGNFGARLVVPRLGSAFSLMTRPMFVLVVDDVHVLRNAECRAALSVLADHVPAGSRLVLAGRTEPPIGIARLRAEGRILEIGPASLAHPGRGSVPARNAASCWANRTWRNFVKRTAELAAGCTWRRSTCGGRPIRERGSIPRR